MPNILKTVNSQILSVTPPHFKKDQIHGIALRKEQLNIVGLCSSEKRRSFERKQMSMKHWRR